MRASKLVLGCSLAVFASAFTALPLFAADPQPKWEQIDEDDGVTVWKMEVPGQHLPSFRGQVIINASVDAILKEMQDNKHHPDWMYRCVESSIVKQINDEQAIVYNRTDSPWPVWDRDVVLDTKFEYTDGGKLLTLSFHNTDPKLRPVPDKTVRMPKLDGYYKMWKLDGNKTKILYEVQADIGGSIPEWLAKRVSKDLPYLTLSRLRDRVAGKI